ncbi:hypothetical protein FB599_2870 [Herbaspirillum sp. SJZ130]|nr:hypothetical protein [Herbaspirillum sp. SJZ102]TQK04318.1 hypothetical protein FB599_2870 [Herbaspirillum sp. SJZ130]TQK09896.1 hypothetical protein FB598_2891 [Herbaspirillum sp. SJZ106]
MWVRILILAFTLAVLAAIAYAMLQYSILD